MKTEVLNVAVRQNAIIIPHGWAERADYKGLNESTSVLVANCYKLGYTFTEDLLHKINEVNPEHKLEILQILKEVTGVNKNWTPLVKQWNIPTGESFVDHIITFIANEVGAKMALYCHVVTEFLRTLFRLNGIMAARIAVLNLKYMH